MSAPVNGGSVSERFKNGVNKQRAEAVWHQAVIASAQRALNNLRLGTDSDSVVETFDDSVRLFYETSEAAPRAEPENYDIPIGLANPFGRR